MRLAFEAVSLPSRSPLMMHSFAKKSRSSAEVSPPAKPPSTVTPFLSVCEAVRLVGLAV